jgi:hypothetical protein
LCELEKSNAAGNAPDRFVQGYLGYLCTLVAIKDSPEANASIFALESIFGKSVQVWATPMSS